MPDQPNGTTPDSAATRSPLEHPVRRLPMPADPTATAATDPFRLTEWNALPDVCFIAGCEGHDIDQRGPVCLRDGSMHKACVEHWVPIFRVLGEQATWEREAMRSE